MKVPAFFIFLFSGALSQSCESELPPLPEFYRATLQYNIKNTDKYSRACSYLNNCEPSPWSRSSEPPKAGYSISIEEGVDDRINAAYIIAHKEILVEGKSLIVTEKIVWNEELTGFHDFLTHVYVEGLEGVLEYCTADSIIEDSAMDWLFGITCKANSTDCVLPSVAHMLHSVGCWRSTGNNTVIRGVNVNEYVAEFEDAGYQMKYYWTDLTNWVSSGGQGKSVPVVAMIKGTFPDGEGGNVPVEMEITFQDFFEVELEKSNFNAPEVVFCRGRELDYVIPHNFPDRFNFGAELVLINSGAGAVKHKIINSRHEWFDYGFNLSRVDYKPVDPKNPLDPFAGDTNLVTEILDFNVGIMYTIDQVLGNCSVKKIKLDENGQVTVDEQGHFIMRSPINLFSMDQKFSYTGEFWDRGIKMYSYITSVNIDPDNLEKNRTIVVYVADGMYTNLDAGGGEKFMPTKIMQYLQDDQFKIDWDTRQTFDVHSFTRTENFMKVFDVCDCYSEKEKMHLSITFSLPSELDLEAASTIFYELSAFRIAEVGQVAIVRISHLQTLVLEGEGVFDLILTVVDPPPLLEGVEYPPLYTRTNKEIKQSLEDSVNGGSFTVLLLGENNAFNLTALKGSLKEVDTENGGKPTALIGHRANITYNRGYTSGAMAGLAFGMIFLGIVVASALYVVFFRNSVRAGLPVLRGFDNPLSGLTSLGK